MIQNYSTNLISPSKVIRGEKAWEEGLNLVNKISKRPLLLGRSSQTLHLRNLIKGDLNRAGTKPITEELVFDCCELDLRRIQEIVVTNKCDGIIAAGGGKVLDAGKLIADRLKIPCITIPLSASTCAGWTALSNIYSSKGAFIKDIALNSCPELLIFDYKFIREAPQRTLASGIADALAKWYEASVSCGASQDGLVQQAVQMARVLRDQLLLDGFEAFKNPKSKPWERVVEGCSLTAGLIGGIGGAKCRTAAAHAIHNGLTQLDFENNKPLHGEIVGIGVILQLQLEELKSKNKLANQAKLQLVDFLSRLNLPISINSLNLQLEELNDLKKACNFACKEGSDIHHLPFSITEKELFELMLESQKINTSKTIKA